MFQTVDVSVHIQIIFESLACNYSSHNGVCCVAEKKPLRDLQQFACFGATMKRVWFSCCVALPFLILSSSLTVVVLGVEIFSIFFLKRGDIVSLTSIKCDCTRQSHRLLSRYGIELWYRRLYSRRCRCQFTHHKSICVSFDLFNSHVWVRWAFVCSFFFVFRQHIIYFCVWRAANV